MQTNKPFKRFKSERQILASLNHPYIAKLIDGGISEKNEPFLIMEFIEGVPITDYAKKEKLTIEQRLQLFLKVCEGVSFAHGNLTIHRDIKPSNILITENGVPKLLDFGLAKLLDSDSGAEITKTATIFRALTPAYASPEQIQGKKVSTSTDVYSLSILLYELLTESRPFDFSNVSISKILQTYENKKLKLPSDFLNSQKNFSNKNLNPKLFKRRPRQYY